MPVVTYVQHYLNRSFLPPVIDMEVLLANPAPRSIPRWLEVDGPNGRGTPYYALASLESAYCALSPSVEMTSLLSRIVGPSYATLYPPEALSIAAGSVVRTREPTTGWERMRSLIPQSQRVSAALTYRYGTEVPGFGRNTPLRIERISHALYWVNRMATMTGAALSDLRPAVSSMQVIARELEDDWVSQVVTMSQRTGMYTRARRQFDLSAVFLRLAGCMAAILEGDVLTPEQRDMRMPNDWRCLWTERSSRFGGCATGIDLHSVRNHSRGELVEAAMGALNHWFDWWYAEQLLIIATAGNYILPVDGDVAASIAKRCPDWHDPKMQRVELRATRGLRRQVR
jgi:hypothetical protein